MKVIVQFNSTCYANANEKKKIEKKEEKPVRPRQSDDSIDRGPLGVVSGDLSIPRKKPAAHGKCNAARFRPAARNDPGDGSWCVCVCVWCVANRVG